MKYKCAILAFSVLAATAGSALAQSSPGMTRDTGAPVGDNQNSKTAGPDGPVLLEDYEPYREARPLRPRTHSRARRARPRRRRPGRLRRQHGLLEVHQGFGLRRARQGDAGLRAVLDGDELPRLARSGPRPPWLRGEVLHGPGQLGHRRHQRAHLLHSRRHQVPGLRARQQAVARHQRAGSRPGLRLLLEGAGVHLSS